MRTRASTFHWRIVLKLSGTSAIQPPVPDGLRGVHIETDNGNMEVLDRICYEERDLTATDLTDSFFAAFSEDFWHTPKMA
jgi:hypothetical protein